MLASDTVTVTARNALQVVANLASRKQSNTRCLNARPSRKNARHFLRDYTRFALARQLTDGRRCRLVVGDRVRRLAPVGHPDRAGEALRSCAFLGFLNLFIYLFMGAINIGGA